MATAGELCIRTVSIAHPSGPIRDVAARMRDHHVGSVVVVEDRPDGTYAPVGIVTDRDLALGALAPGARPADALTAGDLMTSSLVKAIEKDDLETLLARMRTHGVRRLVVVNEAGGLEGLVAFDDVLEYVAQEAGSLVQLVANELALERKRHAIAAAPARP